jgi:hypothetical protein
LRGNLLAKPYWLAPDAEATASEAADVSLEALGPAGSLELLQAVRATTSRDATKRDFFTIRRFMIQARQQRKVLATASRADCRLLPANLREHRPGMDACSVLIRITK